MIEFKCFSSCGIDFNDLNAEQRKKWDGFKVYKESKLAQAMFAKELSERLKGMEGFFLSFSFFFFDSLWYAELFFHYFSFIFNKWIVI